MDQTEEMKEVDVDTTIAVEMAMDPTMVVEEDTTSTTTTTIVVRAVKGSTTKDLHPGSALEEDVMVEEEAEVAVVVDVDEVAE